MIATGHSFVDTTFGVRDNTVKSLLFRAAELLVVFGIWKAFSLLAALQNRFTSFTVFSESPLQKAYFVWTRGLVSRDALLVSTYTLLYTAAQLYGTLLWALDAPGYVTQTHKTPASSLSTSFLLDHSNEYIVSYNITTASLNATTADLASPFSTNLFRPGTNATLTGTFIPGTPSALLNPSHTDEPRIWLDADGWSLTTDTYAHIATRLGGANESDQFSCAFADVLPGTSRIYNCTFDNEWALDMLAVPIGTPLVYYNRRATENHVSSNIAPRRSDIWNSIGASSATAARMHVFTVTKGLRRHTFVSNAFKASIVGAGEEIPRVEMEDLMRRTAGEVPEGREADVEAGMGRILDVLVRAQEGNRSAVVGMMNGDGKSVVESFWEMYNVEGRPGDVKVRTFRLTGVNITLLRSEDIETAPKPYEECSYPAFQNVAVGGKVVDTDCIGGAKGDLNGTEYFGQVDSCAVLHVTGLDKAPYGDSKAALDPVFQRWLEGNVLRLQDLLLSRGYMVGLDPGLVEVEVTTTTPGISFLQVFMVILAAGFAAVSWGGLVFFASGHWSSSLFVSLVTTTMTTTGKSEPGFVCEIPEIKIEERDGKMELRTEQGVFKHQGDELPVYEHPEKPALGDKQDGKVSEEPVVTEHVASNVNTER